MEPEGRHVTDMRAAIRSSEYRCLRPQCTTVVRLYHFEPLPDGWWVVIPARSEAHAKYLCPECAEQRS